VTPDRRAQKAAAGSRPVASRPGAEPRPAPVAAGGSGGGPADRRFVPGGLGARIRALRSREGLSQRELAKHLGFSASALSMIESNQSGVSLRRLQKVAQYFNVDMVDLLAEDKRSSEAAPPIEIVRKCVTSAPGVRRGKGTTYQVLGVHKNRQIQPAILSFAPGASYADDKIRHAGEEFVFVLLGSVNLCLEDETISLEQGDLAIFSSELLHAYENGSEFGPAVLISAGTPPW